MSVSKLLKIYNGLQQTVTYAKTPHLKRLEKPKVWPSEKYRKLRLLLR